MAVSAFKSASRRSTSPSPAPSTRLHSSRNHPSSNNKRDDKKQDAYVRPNDGVWQAPPPVGVLYGYSIVHENPLFGYSAPSSPESMAVCGTCSNVVDNDCQSASPFCPPEGKVEKTGCFNAFREVNSERPIERQQSVDSCGALRPIMSCRHCKGCSCRSCYSKGLMTKVEEKYPVMAGHSRDTSVCSHQDSLELVSDIRKEYVDKLLQSVERVQKLRADLAVEEQREMELRNILEDGRTVPDATVQWKSQPERKKSIDQFKLSRSLAEEVMNYFEECVSLSTFDSADLFGTDFSTPDDSILCSAARAHPEGCSRLSEKAGQTLSAFSVYVDELNYHEDYRNQTQCLISIAGSDLCSTINKNTCYPDESDCTATLHSTSCGSSPAHEPLLDLEAEIGLYMKELEKGKRYEKVFPEGQRSCYDADDYHSMKEEESLLCSVFTLKDRIHSGGLLLCRPSMF